MRDKSIDVLRAIALIGLVIIHIAPPSLVVKELRSFDVPMMVFLSGVSFMMSSSKDSSYASYVVKRFQRIIVPTWIFLLIYYFAIIGGTIILGKQIHFDILLPQILRNFSLMTSWYPWVMRLFFIIALLAPLFSSIVNRLNSKQFVTIFLVLLLVNEVLIDLTCTNIVKNDWRVIIEMNLPYLLVFYVGTRLKRMCNKEIAIWALLSMVVSVGIAVFLYATSGDYISLQVYKYPPRLYYLSYGFACIFGLWLIRDKIVNILKRVQLFNLFCFIGRHTLWIYLWHIVFVLTVNEKINSSLIRLIIVISGAIVITYIQTFLLNKILVYVEKQKTKSVLNLIFNG